MGPHKETGRAFAHCVARRAARTLVTLGIATAAGLAHASVFYELNIVAQTGVAPFNFTSLGNGPSVNDKGKVGFVGRYSNGPTIAVWSPLGGATDLATNFLSPNRSFGEAVRINSNDEIVTWNRVLPQAIYEVRVFRAATPNDTTIMVRGTGAPPYDLLYQNPTINNSRVLEDRSNFIPTGNKDGVCNAGEVCMSQVAFNAPRLPSRFVGTVVRNPSDAADPGVQHEFALNNTVNSRPMIADDGRVVIRGNLPTNPIILFNNYALSSQTQIANTTMGFTAIGNAPGITPDGKIVAFAADRGEGVGIFLSIEGTGGVRKVFRIAGENNTAHHPELGVNGAGAPLYFGSIDIDSRVGIIYTPDSQGVANKSIVISFIGTPNAASRTNPGTGNPFLFSGQKGLWTMRIDVDPELFLNICAVRVPNGGGLPTGLGGDDQLMSLPGRWWIDAGANGKCETENSYGFDMFFSRGSPLPVVQVGDKIGAGGAHTVSDISVNDPIAQANFDVSLLPRAERQGDHRVTFWASIDGGAGQMIVVGDHLDSDQDGLLDHWETHGIDLDGTGSIDLDLPGMGANPFKRDLFVQLDWTADRPLPLNFNGRHRPTVGLIRQLAQYFAAAPARADGIGAGIVLHVDAGPTAVDPVGQPFSRNMGIGAVVGGNTVPGGPVDLSYFGQPNSVTVPGVNAVAFDTMKSQIFWTHHRGAREFAFMHIVLTDHNGMKDATGKDNNANPLQAQVASPRDAFSFELPPSFTSARILNKAIKITSGTGAGQMRAVSAQSINGSNGNAIITVKAALATQPDATSTIVPFSLSSGEGHAFLRPDANFAPGRDLDITMGTYSTTPNAEWASAFHQYATMLHEMGHLFSLTHGGVNHDAWNPAYHSIMSYSYQFCQAPNKGRTSGGSVLVNSADCPVQTYSDSTDPISDNWKHFDLRFSQNFAVLSQAFGADPAMQAIVPFPPAREADIDDILAIYPPIDTIAPKAAIVAPVGGSTFALGSAISITASATDNVAVTRAEVAFDVNGDGVVDDSEIFVPTFTPPSTFTFTLPPTSGPSSARKLSFIAYDAGANPAVATVTINVGSVAPVTVPNVVGQALDVASTTITAANLAVGAVTYQQSGGIAAGALISQAPGGGTSRAAGTPIDLVVSLGPNGARVPNVQGLSQSAANSALSSAGLTTGTVTMVSTNDPPGVLSQFPLADSIVPSGSAVALLIVQAGSISVPDVVGLTQAAASTAITNAGLVVGTVTQQASNSVPAGSVISQSPIAGKLVVSGSAVDLVISSGPPQASVPNVVGLTQAAATNAIINAGLVVGTVTSAPSDTVPSGSVISQNPVGGASVAPGSAVDIVVSSGPPPPAQRTFVSPDGNDANFCTVVTPCRSFTRAIARTTAGGEVIVLASAGYGPAIIDKALTIAASQGVYAGISVSSGTGIVVNPGSGRVTLIGLAINGLGGTIGIDFQSGDALYVERTVVSGFTGAGLNAALQAPAGLFVRDSIFRGNGTGASVSTSTGVVQVHATIERSLFESNATGLALTGYSSTVAIRGSFFTAGSNGIAIQPGIAGAASAVDMRNTIVSKNGTAGIVVGGNGGTVATVSITGSQVTGNGIGLDAQAGGTAYATDTTIARNTTGLRHLTGAIVSLGDNRVTNNGTNGTFSSTVSKQ